MVKSDHKIKDYYHYLGELKAYLDAMLVFSRLGLALTNEEEDKTIEELNKEYEEFLEDAEENFLHMLQNYIQEKEDPKVREEMSVVYEENIDEFKWLIKAELERIRKSLA